MNKTETIKKMIAYTGLSTRSFAEKADLPYTTLCSMLQRGIDNASVNNVIKICKVLNISVDYLYNISENKSPNLTEDQSDILNNYKKLNSSGKKEALKRINELTQIHSYIAPENT